MLKQFMVVAIVLFPGTGFAGWGGAEWGMSRSSVEGLLDTKEIRGKDDYFVHASTVSGYSVEVTYQFGERGLNLIAIIPVDSDDCTEFYYDVRRTYGAPIESDEDGEFSKSANWRDDENDNDVVLADMLTFCVVKYTPIPTTNSGGF